MKQTAVDWLVEQVNSDCLNSTFIRKEMLDQAKLMEKEQIIRTHLMARCYDTENSVNEAEQYYNETFKSE